MEQRKWRKLNGEPLHQPIGEEVREVLIRETNQGHQLKVCIGTDSQVKGRETEFATVIVFIRKGKGGFMFISKMSTTRRMTVKQRMLEEVWQSMELALNLCGLFTIFQVDIELHADINTNPNFKSNDALKEAMGYIQGVSAGWSGGTLAFRAKPLAFASSNCANKMVQ